MTTKRKKTIRAEWTRLSLADRNSLTWDRLSHYYSALRINGAMDIMATAMMVQAKAGKPITPAHATNIVRYRMRVLMANGLTYTEALASVVESVVTARKYRPSTPLTREVERIEARNDCTYKSMRVNRRVDRVIAQVAHSIADTVDDDIRRADARLTVESFLKALSVKDREILSRYVKAKAPGKTITNRVAYILKPIGITPVLYADGYRALIAA